MIIIRSYDELKLTLNEKLNMLENQMRIYKGDGVSSKAKKERSIAYVRGQIDGIKETLELIDIWQAVTKK